MKNILQKIIAILGAAMLATTVAVMPAMAIERVQEVDASGEASGTGTTGATGGACNYFLGMKSWDCNVSTNPQNEDELKGMIIGIALNVLSDATVIAGYLVLGYVMWGGYKYMFSYGDPAKMAAGKKTLVSAFIGLAIVLLAEVILSAIRIALGASSFVGIVNVDAAQVASSLITWFTAMAGIVAAIFVVYGGITYVTAAGDPGKLTKAKNAITYALIGLAIVALAQIITAFVSGAIRDAGTSVITEIIIG